MNKDLTLVLLTHNRAVTLAETLESVFAQDYSDFTIVISDNSTNEETSSFIQTCKWRNRIIYKRRKPDLPFNFHLEQNLKEIKTRYCIMFHDDDLMFPSMVRILYNVILNSNYTAVAANAYILNNEIITKKKMNPISHNLLIDSVDILARQYCAGKTNPFPGYIYDVEKISSLEYKMIANKYSDAVWISEIVKKGQVLWLCEPLMYYRVSEMQDSQQQDIEGQRKLGEYWKKNTSSLIHEEVDRWLIGCEYCFDKSRKRFSLLYYLKNSPFKYFPKALIKQLLSYLRTEE